MCDMFYGLCQVFERSDGNPQGITDFVYQQFCALVHREVEKLKGSTLAPARDKDINWLSHGAGQMNYQF